jgi:hypothetical protein
VSLDLLSGYLDNQVTAGERARVERHLRDCAACRNELETLRQTVALLHALPRAPVPRAFTLSEVQVGIRRPAGQPTWYGGLARGLAAVAAVVLVAIVAVGLLRRPAAQPAAPVAWAPPTLAPTAASVEREMTPAEEAAPPKPTHAPALSAPASPQVERVVEKEVVVSPTAAAAEPEVPAAEKAVEPAPIPTAAAAAKALPAPASPVTEAPGAMALAVPPAQTQPVPEAVPAVGFGRGGGEPAEPSAQERTPAPLPQAAAVTSTLPAGAAMVYADWQSVWAVDGQAGVRPLVGAAGAHMPLISPDRAWIVYRVINQDITELWAIRWEVGPPRKLLTERELPKEDLGPGYGERRIHDLRWIPGSHALAMTTVAYPTGDAAAQIELWSLNVESGALARRLELGQYGVFAYSPDGKTIARLRRGGEQPSTGSLVLFNADGTGERTALEFPVGVPGYGYESQLAWLPDGRTLLVAIFAAGLDPERGDNAIIFYRVPVEGQAQEIGRIQASDTFWSPDGAYLAYTRSVTETLENRELFLADAGGSNAQRYAALGCGTFAGWAPDGRHFLYYSENQAYLGAPGRPPQSLGSATDVADPHWLAAGQLLYLADRGSEWVLIYRTLDGSPASLTRLPKDITYDVTRP